MNKYLQSFALSFFLFAMAFSLNTQTLHAYNRWSSHNNERGAWGGNGGWWGNSRSDWYGEYGTPEEYEYFGNYTTPRSTRYGHYNRYYSPNQFPMHGEYYQDNVDGAAIYFSAPIHPR